MNGAPVLGWSADAPPSAEMEAALARSAHDLSVLFARHTELLGAALSAGTMPNMPCASPTCACRRLLRATLMEVIAELEETRKSFKSPRLAALRQKLVRLLAEQT